MIIYYDNKTGKIHGVIMGRVHNEFELKPNLIQVEGVEQKDVSRLILDIDETIEVEKFLEENKTKVMGCEVNIKTKKLRKKTV